MRIEVLRAIARPCGLVLVVVEYDDAAGRIRFRTLVLVP
jgi:hypothetical protein